MVDKETRLDNVISAPGNVIVYNYTLVNFEKGAVDTTALKNYIGPIATNNIKTNPSMKYMRDNKVTMSYYYKDKNGSYLFNFKVVPYQYKN